MSWTNSKQSMHSLVYSITVISLAAFGLWFGVQANKTEANTKSTQTNAAPAATFAGANVGLIPDGPGSPTCGNDGAPRNVTFDVTGISGAPTDVQVQMTFGSPNPTWAGDITAVLIAPNGASHTLFGYTGSTVANGCGSNADLAGPYTFADSAISSWWQTVTSTGASTPVASGSYRTSNRGGAGATNPMPPTSMNPVFSGVANPNGTWTLRITDGGAGDTGAIASAILTLTESTAPSADANVDFDGDGKTDFVIARGTDNPLTEATAPGVFGPRRQFDSSADTKTKSRMTKTENTLAPPIYWYTSINGSGATSVAQLGDAMTDFLTPEDFDGDGKDDIAVWTEGPPTEANFKILQSTTNTVRVEVFGQTGDDPAVVGDYDGDGIADPAVFRCPPFNAAPGQCYFFYRGSNNNPSGNITYVPWGFGVDGDFYPLIGDFDGDGKYDFNLQRSNPSSPSQGQFVLLRSSDLGVEYINWGLATDFLIPGDYDGDGKADICVRRTVSGSRQHWILHRTGATSFVVWGITGDVSTPGDYDGDGKTDLAVWRGSSNADENFFWVLNSSNSSVTTFEWGQCATSLTCDFPVAGWAVH